MSTRPSGWKNIAFNVMLGGLALVVLVLLYALATRYLWPAADPARDANPAELAGDIIQVEVRNGCGIAGLGEDMRDFLRQAGFDVVGVGNHTSFDQAKTLVVDRVGNPAAARKVAAALGLPEDRIIEEIRQDYFLDASVIIGKDYATLLPFQGD